ncbi:hypothetical protein METP3_03070 [Methanosarcinales archaeon]|nr:hypothetical protein METP3_03070 [Methanosarcinales archaeon]
MEALKKFNEQLRSRKASQPKALLIVNHYVFSFLKKKPIETFYTYWHSSPVLKLSISLFSGSFRTLLI